MSTKPWFLFLILALIPASHGVSLAYPDICSIADSRTEVTIGTPLFIRALDAELTVSGVSGVSKERYKSEEGRGFVYILTFNEAGKGVLDDKVAKCAVQVTVSNIEERQKEERTKTRLEELTRENADYKSRLQEMDTLKIANVELARNLTTARDTIAANQTVYQALIPDKSYWTAMMASLGTKEVFSLFWDKILFVAMLFSGGFWLIKSHLIHRS